MSITVLLFASAADRAGTRRATLAREPGDTVARVRGRLATQFPGIAALFPTLLYAVNEEYVGLDAAVEDGDTLALIPPVSGG